MSLANVRYRTSAPPRQASELSDNTYDYAPGHASYDEESFDAESTDGVHNSASRRKLPPRGSKLSRARRDNRGPHRGAKEKSSSATVDALTKVVSSAQRIQINELKNEIESLATELEEIRKENKVLKRTVFIHEKSLGKYEDKDSDLPQLMERHNQEIHALRELMRRCKDENRKLSRALRDTQDELEVTKKQLKKLQTLAESDSLVERDDLSKKLKASTEELEKKTERIAELERHIELLVKNHNRELNVETKRLRDVKLELEDLQQKFDKHSRVKEIGTHGGGGLNEKSVQQPPSSSVLGISTPQLTEPRGNRGHAANATPRVTTKASDESCNHPWQKDQASIMRRQPEQDAKETEEKAAPGGLGRAGGSSSIATEASTESSTVSARQQDDSARSPRGSSVVQRRPLGDDHGGRTAANSHAAGSGGSVVVPPSVREDVKLSGSSSGKSLLKQDRNARGTGSVEQLSPSWDLPTRGPQQASESKLHDSAEKTSVHFFDLNETNSSTAFRKQAVPGKGSLLFDDGPAQRQAASQDAAAAAEERKKKDLLLQRMKEIDRGRGLASVVEDPLLPTSFPPRGPKPLDTDDVTSTSKPALERRDKLLKLLHIDSSVEAAAAIQSVNGQTHAYQSSVLPDSAVPSSNLATSKKSNLISELFANSGGKASLTVAAAEARDTMGDDDIFTLGTGKKQNTRAVRHVQANGFGADSEPDAVARNGALLPHRNAIGPNALRTKPVGGVKSYFDHHDDDDIEEVHL